MGPGAETSIGGRPVHVGSERFLRAEGISLDDVVGTLRDLSASGQPAVLGAVDGAWPAPFRTATASAPRAMSNGSALLAILNAAHPTPA